MRHYVFTVEGKLYNIKAYSFREALQQVACNYYPIGHTITDEDLKNLHAQLERTYSE